MQEIKHLGRGHRLVKLRHRRGIVAIERGFLHHSADVHATVYASHIAEEVSTDLIGERSRIEYAHRQSIVGHVIIESVRVAHHRRLGEIYGTLASALCLHIDSLQGMVASQLAGLWYVLIILHINKLYLRRIDLIP